MLRGKSLTVGAGTCLEPFGAGFFPALPEGLDYGIGYTVTNGDYVNTTGRHRYNDSDGYIWYELTDGNWIAGSLIGY